ncbi:hypothetical protein [Streptomyces lydicus]|uniref:hypothetical protein n=1 Tax=Streptomyces lydicus TaxID=47763 RepID=UPI003794CF6B
MGPITNALATEPPRRQELQMARTLMDIAGEGFRLEDEHDAYRAALEQVVAARLEGFEPPHAPAPVEGGPVDLIAALEQSVQAARAHRRAGRSGNQETTTSRRGQRRKQPGRPPAD